MWSNVYATVATSAATLLGLLFVAVQFNLEQLSTDHPSHWLSIARATWIVFASVFLVALVYLMPLGAEGRILGTGVVLAVSARRIVSAWLPLRGRVDRTLVALQRTLWVMVGPLLLYGVLFGYTIALAHGAKVQVEIVYAFIALIGLALRNSWDLLVELRILPSPSASGSTGTDSERSSSASPAVHSTLPDEK